MKTIFEKCGEKRNPQYAIRTLKSKINGVLSFYLFAALASVFFPSAPPVRADDVGISKARLIQTSPNSYVVEADVTQALAWTIKAPIFPDRFQVSELEFINQSGWIVVQAKATTGGGALNHNDQILLPWMRNGVALTVQWQDGTIRQGLFMRSLEGIYVPLRLLMDTPQTLRDVCRQQFTVGLQHLGFKGVHMLLVAALCLVFSPARAFTALGCYAFGQALSLVLSDLGIPGFDLLLADILGIVLVILIAVSAFRQTPAKPFMVLAAVYGLAHGLAYAQEVSHLALSIDHQVPALFMFNFAVDAGHFIAAGFLLLFKTMWDIRRLQHLGIYAIGSLAVTLLLIIFHEHVLAGKTSILPLDDTQIATRFALPAAQKPQAGSQRPRGARKLTSPIMTYLSVEPYEVRQEVLIQARAAVQFLGVDERGMGSIPVNSQEAVKQGILEMFQKANPITIDGSSPTPVLTRADFVTLGAAGVVVRPEPVVESLDRGIVGLTIVYETPEMADDIVIDWRLFSETVQRVEATSTDPFGGATMILSPDERRWHWKRRLNGYRVPVIETIAVEKQKLPVVSIALFSGVAVLTTIAFLRRRSIIGRPVLLGILGLGFVMYPFVTYPLDLPWVSSWAPSHDRTGVIVHRLLTNVYRAFDVRDENRVYDRLAVSVTGDQLTQIYLENRRSLEFENRGGARANVDEVKILSINDVKRSADGGFVADANWTVGGSVSHFGHTHYRQNRYHALVTFVIADDAWKIRAIELIDEKRIL